MSRANKLSGAQRVRVIGGFWRSRLLNIVDQPGLRPSTDRVRETLFNWLVPYIQQANCIDLFAGTGVLGFEAISRGASHLRLIESNPRVAKQLNLNLQALRPFPDGSDIEVIHEDALKWLNSQTQIDVDMVFVDPPFDQGELLLKTLTKLGQVLNHSPTTIIYVESPSGTSDELLLECLPQYGIDKQLLAGAVKASLLKPLVD